MTSDAIVVENWLNVSLEIDRMLRRKPAGESGGKNYEGNDLVAHLT
jgi:hypothetical protein